MPNLPSMSELNCLSRILRKATHRTVADAFLKAFMWACWPEWYEHNKWELYESKGQPRHAAPGEKAR
jgi:hypothetical protein